MDRQIKVIPAVGAGVLSALVIIGCGTSASEEAQDSFPVVAESTEGSAGPSLTEEMT